MKMQKNKGIQTEFPLLNQLNMKRIMFTSINEKPFIML
jgi:hypothetical protein